MSAMDHEAQFLAREMAIFDFCGPNADSDAQRAYRRRGYETWLLPEFSKTIYSEEGERFVAGKDYWLDFARFTIAVIDAYRRSSGCVDSIGYDEIIERYEALVRAGPPQEPSQP